MSNLTDGSRIFEGFRALGLHSSDVGHVFKYNQIRKAYLLYSAVGKVFHTYACPKLLLRKVSNQHPSDIECIAADEWRVFTSCGDQVFGVVRGEFFEFKYTGHKSTVHILLPFGNHLISVDRESCVKIWHIESEELYLSLEFSNDTFEISAALHPTTYLNKILFASKQGTMQLWNISRNKLVYEFHSLKQSPITVLEQAPAIDVVGIGNECGDIFLHNIKLDRIVMQLNQEGGPVTCLSFRTDGETIMAAGNAIGHVYLWDLGSKKVKGVIEKAHSSAVARATFMQGQPLLITNSPDNAIKIWEFEKGSGVGTLMHAQCGHVGSLTKIRYYKEEHILSAGSDSTLKMFATHGRLSKNLGQASLSRKRSRKNPHKADAVMLPPVVDFAFETVREGEWDGLIAAHYRHPVATTWNLQCERMGAHKFKLHDRNRLKIDALLYVSTVACTSCGNFCLIGYNNGTVDAYNLQSGLHRGSYIDTSLPVRTAHESHVKVIQVDGLNQVTITAGADRKVKFWKFKDKTLLLALEVQAKPALASLHKASSLMALALDDFTITLVDVDTRKIVRRFKGHAGTINDLAWSEDARWVVTCGMDCCVKTWDVPSASLVDCFVVDDAAVSVAFSPNSDFLATAHVDDVGIYLWSNRTLYGYVNLSPLPHTYHPEKGIDLPATVAPHEAEEVTVEERDLTVASSDVRTKERDQLASDLLTLSRVPYAKWANVLQLDNIRKRNKPKEPPKAPKNAPFFLPTSASLQPEFVAEEEKDDDASRLKVINPVLHLSEFATTLLKADSDFSDFMNLLKSMSLLNIDTEIKCLSPDGGGTIDLLETFLEFIEQSIDSKRDFEVVQAYFNLFLSAHLTTLYQLDDIVARLERIDGKLNKDRLELSRLLNQNQCIVNYVKSATL